jgi:ribA/ribD-fused uncharacterized protein
MKKEIIGPFTDRYRFLSNFYDINAKIGEKISFNGHMVPTTEHAYQAAKALNYEDFLKIIHVKTPEEAKHLGRELEEKGQIRPDWSEVKLNIMYDINKKKFSIPALKERLLKTETRELVEYNWWGDKFWGVDEKTEEGQNNLGQILMKIRTELQPQTSGLGNALFTSKKINHNDLELLAIEDKFYLYNWLQGEIWENYFGYVEDWCIFPLEFTLDDYWYIGPGFFSKESVVFSPSKEALLNKDEKNVYSNSFLPQTIYEGSDGRYTMILVDTHTDGNQYLQILDNTKKINPPT